MLSLFLIVLPITLLAAISPGPDALVVIKNALSRGRIAGIFTALGVALWVLVHVAYCIAGVGLIISQSILLFQIVKILGALYLLYLAYQLIRSQWAELNTDEKIIQTRTIKRDFLDGFLTNVLNPKATLFFLAVFTQVIDPKTPLLLQGMLGLSMAVVVGLWFMTLSCFLGTSSLRQKIARASKWIDRTMGVLLAGLGFKILFSDK